MHGRFGNCGHDPIELVDLEYLVVLDSTAPEYPPEEEDHRGDQSAKADEQSEKDTKILNYAAQDQANETVDNTDYTNHDTPYRNRDELRGVPLDPLVEVGADFVPALWDVVFLFFLDSYLVRLAIHGLPITFSEHLLQTLAFVSHPVEAPER